MLSLSDTPITLLLLIVNVFISGYALFADPSLLDRFAFKPHAILKRREFYRLLSGGFVHAGVGHLLFNMITLFFFGPLLEMRLGVAGFVVLYFGAEMAAHGLALWMHRDNPAYTAVGASGAISGVVFAYCLYQPFSMLLVFFVPIPAILFAIGFVVLSVYAMSNGEQRGETGGLAHEAHLGGALGGLVLTVLLDPASLSIFLGQLGF